MKTIDVATLQSWLARDDAVTVVDVRPQVDYAEWLIPGSVHVNAYDALKAGRPDALANLDIPATAPVVTVCGAGKVSITAAEQLAARGLDVYSLDGGMKAWSMAWNVAPVSSPTQTAIIQVRRTGKGCLSYLVMSDGDAAVIDASLPPEVYQQLAREARVNIRYVLDTHIHADHLSRSRLLATATGADLLLPETDRVSFPFTPVADGAMLPMGRASLRALHSPGHTWESTCYLLDDAVLFTGDTLFLRGVGRPDLAASDEEGHARAVALYRSLHRLRRLPPESVVLPGHVSTPVAFDQVALSSSLGDVIEHTPLLALDEASFVASLWEKRGATPPNYAMIVALNEQGILPAADPTDLEAGANRCAIA